MRSVRIGIHPADFSTKAGSQEFDKIRSQIWWSEWTRNTGMELPTIKVMVCWWLFWGDIGHVRVWRFNWALGWWGGILLQWW